MLEFVDDDFQPIHLQKEDRGWVCSLLSDLPGDILEEVLFCRLEKAPDIENQILPFCQTLSRYIVSLTASFPLTTEDFRTLSRLEHTVASVEKTKHWLMALGIPPQTRMVLSYDFKTAFMMPWITFIRYYDAFCYGGLDDICMCSVCERWYVLYYHEDLFLFGERKQV